MFSPRPLQFSLGTAFLLMILASLVVFFHVYGWWRVVAIVDPILLGPCALYAGIRLLSVETESTILALLLAIVAMILFLVGTLGTLVLVLNVLGMLLDLLFVISGG